MHFFRTRFIERAKKKKGERTKEIKITMVTIVTKNGALDRTEDENDSDISIVTSE